MPKKNKRGNRKKPSRGKIAKHRRKLQAVATMVEVKGMAVEDISDFMGRRGMGRPSPERVWKLYREYLASAPQGKQEPLKGESKPGKTWVSKAKWDHEHR